MMNRYKPIKDDKAEAEGDVDHNQAQQKKTDQSDEIIVEDDEFFDAPEQPKQRDDAKTEPTIPREPVKKLPIPRNVTASVSEKNPAHGIIVTWENQESSENFQYEAFLKCDTDIVKEQTIDGTKQEACFEDLKPNTCYTAYVSIASNDEKSEQIPSNPVTTSQDPDVKLPKIKNVVARVHTNNPVRWIVVNWDKQDSCENFKLKVWLRSGKKNIMDVIVDGAQQEACFKGLRSNTCYTAYASIADDEQNIEPICSKPITTHRATRNAKFDIARDGKPKITSCSTVHTNDGLMSQFTWNLPTLGAEENNYDVVEMQAVIVTNKKPMVLKIEEGNTRAKAVPLEFGTTYEFSVKCVYLDIDKHHVVEAKSESTIYTEIGTALINEVNCHGQEIKVSWSPARGATKHTLKIIGLDKPLSKNMGEKKTYFTIKVPEPRNYGRICTLTIEAIGGADKTSKSDPHEILIGGDRAVTAVGVEKCTECPRRQVLVKWTPPKCRPEGYTLQLYELKNGKSEEAGDSIALEHTQLSHNFVELKTSTMYNCKVFPRYGGKTAYGSLSNVVETDKRVKGPLETKKDFGKPEEVVHTASVNKSGYHVTEISWKMVNTGENYKVSQYEVVVSPPSSLLSKFSFNKDKYDKKFSPNETKAEISNLEMGLKYDVKITSWILDLDTRKTTQYIKDYYFHTEPSKTQINDCEFKDGAIAFSWTKVIGAKKYCLLMKDEFQTEHVAEDVIVTENKCQVQMTEKLCIGKTCTTKVIAYVNEMTSESDWKTHLLGGVLVPRNVKASRSTENPKRSILVTFDAPKQGPADQYKIVAKPESGKQKPFFCNASPFLIEYLRKGIKYKFDVHAKHGEIWSEASPSNYEETDRGDENTPPVNFSKIKGTVNAPKSSFYGSTTSLSIAKGKSFGKVRDLKTTSPPHERNEVDILTLSWMIPNFGNNAFDYKVEKYKVEIRKKDSHECEKIPVDFKKGSVTYSIQRELELGKTYEIFVSTTYTDIDQDEEYTSSAEKTTVQTRPCKPNVMEPQVMKMENGEDALKIEWDSEKDADRYEVEIYTDESEPRPLYKENMENRTKWSRTFMKGFGFGTSYYAVITAFNKGNKGNSFKTVRNTIGGDLSPKKVNATHSKVDDPNTQVYLSWMQPPEVPESYEISYENCGETKKIICKETEYLVNNLKAGDYYTFKVVAVFKETRSGGCLSNKIQTNPTPTQVKNVGTSPGDNPSTGIKIYWEKVEAEKKNESTAYRVTITSVDKATSREIKNVAEDYLLVFGLEPDTEYFTTVAGGNSIGFGKDSEKVPFKTERGTPKEVELLNHVDEVMQSTSLLLKFTDAEGGPLKYVGSLYKRQNEYLCNPNVEVKSGHIFTDLEPNTEYFAVVHAVFEGKKTGKDKHSGTIITAPSKPEINDGQCCVDNGINSSKDLTLKWKSDAGCTEHEIQIKHGDEIENVQTVNNRNDLRYSCQHEASQYTARVRTKNTLFGMWSDKVIIVLAPKKIINVTAKLEEKGSNIIIQCNKAASGSFSYICQPFHDGQVEGEPMQVHPKESDGIVNFIFVPTQHAGKYHFELWAEDNNELRGESSFSEIVISRPCPVKIERVERMQENPSTDIVISWEAHDRCNGYEIKIKKSGNQKPESIVRMTDEKICTYRCQCPGSSYGVRVRGICSPVLGYWSEKKFVELAPTEVKLIEDRDEQEPVETVKVKWNELNPLPESYHVVLYQGDDEVDKADIKVEQREENKPEPTSGEHVFKDLVKPGLLYYCTVAAHNHGVFGRPIKTKSYRIKWNTPESLLITPDENDPSKRAKISWDIPDGVNCFRLEIENNQLGSVTHLKLDENYYVFESGIPGNSYTVRLYSGRDGSYSPGCVSTTMSMKPNPPTNIKAVANSQVNGIIVTYKESSTQPKTYEVCAKQMTKEGENEELTTVKTTEERAVIKNLVPGESYEVSVTALYNNERSKTVTLDGYVLTYPATVVNLRSSEDENGVIIYKWDALKIPPDEYIIQWRINNEPVMEESTEETEFAIQFLKPAHFYKLRVMASNSAGRGKICNWNMFVTGPNPPTNIKAVAIKEVNGIIVTYKESASQPKTYEVCAKRLTKEDENEDPAVVVTTEERAVLSNLVLGGAYAVSVTTLCNDKKSKTITLDEYVSTFPDEVANLRSSKKNVGTIVFEWDPLEITPDKYVVHWKVNNGEITEEFAKNPKFEILLPKPAKAYNLRVMASNSAGYGEMTAWETFITDPLPPRYLKVVSDENDPQSSFFVTYEDDLDPLKEYRVTAVTAGEREEEAAPPITTKGLKAHITGLGHGRSYYFKVQTLFCGKKSEELFYVK